MSEKEIAVEAVAVKILVVRGRKVMLDRDLAELYGVKTRDLNKAVERNRDRFPDDFMYQLTKEEVANLKFQFGTSSWGGTRKLPNVFTEQGVRGCFQVYCILSVQCRLILLLCGRLCG